MRLLEYHEHKEDEFTYAFFNHYYHNQWLYRDSLYPEETVTEIIRENGEVQAVMGNDYDRSGRLLYSGMYRDRLYEGEGKFYTEDRSYYEGKFVDGKKEGVFEKKSERYVERRDVFLNDKRYGECIEFYNDGSKRARYEYKNDMKNGLGLVFKGDGSLLMKGTYVDNVQTGVGYEYLGSSICRKGEYVNGHFVQEQLMYHHNPKCCFDRYKKQEYDDTYYLGKPEPIEMGQYFTFCRKPQSELCRVDGG